MLADQPDAIRSRAERARMLLNQRGIALHVVGSVAAVGAGAFPTAELPSFALELPGEAQGWSGRLRAGDPPVVGRARDGRFLLDLRTVRDEEIPQLVDAVVRADG